MSQSIISKIKITTNKSKLNLTLFNDKKFLILVFCILSCAWIINNINQHFFQYTGNNYLHPFQMSVIISYCLIHLFASLILPELEFLQLRFLLILQVLFTTLIIVTLTNAIQLTPYTPIDTYLIKFEFFPLEKSVAWVRNSPKLEECLMSVYQSLNLFMLIIPFLLAIFQRVEEVNHYCRFLLTSVFVGFIFYFFFPSCGPASILNPSLFLDVQHANHLKFWEIHHQRIPSTLNGGLIAFPSFHVIWAWACTRAVKTINKGLFIFCLLWFTTLSISCFVLGWHYSIDILGSIVIIYVLEKHAK